MEAFVKFPHLNKLIYLEKEFINEIDFVVLNFNYEGFKPEPYFETIKKSHQYLAESEYSIIQIVIVELENFMYENDILPLYLIEKIKDQLFPIYDKLKFIKNEQAKMFKPDFIIPRDEKEVDILRSSIYLNLTDWDHINKFKELISFCNKYIISNASTTRQPETRIHQPLAFEIIEIDNFELMAILDQKGVIQRSGNGMTYVDQAKKAKALINDDGLYFDKYKQKKPLESFEIYIKQYFGNDPKFENAKKKYAKNDSLIK